MKKENDFGRDSIPLLVLKISIPFMFAQFVNVLYSIVDRIYIGNIPVIGADSLAGAGVCAPIITLLSSFGTLIGIGGSVLFSVRLGAGDEKALSRYWQTVFLCCLFFGNIDDCIFTYERLFTEMVWGKRRYISVCQYLYDYLHAWNFFRSFVNGDELFYYGTGISGAWNADDTDRSNRKYRA